MLTAGSHNLSVTFTPSDGVNYSTATASVPLTVTQAAPAITWAPPAAIGYGTALGSGQLNAIANAAGTFAYTPAAGSLPGLGVSTLSVTFTPTDTADYTAATASVPLTVVQGTPVISWVAPVAIEWGTALSAGQLNATANIPGTFVYTPPLAAVLTPGPQTLTVTFTPADAADYTPATANVVLTVKRATPQVTWAAPAAIPYGTALNAAQLDATGSVPGSFAYVPALGTVLNAGTRTISATFTPADAVNYAPVTASVSLTVNRIAPVVTWPGPAAIAYGTALSSPQLNATANLPGSFLYVPAPGTILSAGTQTLHVTFTPSDSTNYTNASGSASLTVNQGTPVLSWATPGAIAYGTPLGSGQLNATANTAGTFSYAPPLNTVLSLGAHTLSATFTPTDPADYTTATAGVSLVVNQATPVIGWPAPAPIEYGTSLGPSLLNATANVPGTFAYSPALATLLPAGAQTLLATFTPSDTTDYTTATATVALTVNRATPALTWAAPAAIPYGTPLSAAQLNATASVPGTFAYNPAAGTIVTVGAHPLSVTFTPADGANYQPASAGVTLAVNPATPLLSWPDPQAISYGTTLSAVQLNATANVPGTFVYSPAPGTLLAPGSYSLSGTFTPTDKVSYTIATAKATLSVTQATPTLTWPVPAAIPYKTPLSAAQLNATANVPGAFTYTPPSGTLLDAGSQLLAVTFTPADTADFTTASATIPLTVRQATPVLRWTTSGPITYGTPLGVLQLNATADVAGTFSYNPPLGALLGAGTQTLTATFTPDSVNYAVAAVSANLVVNRATPVLTWAPAPAVMNSAINGAQLNATATVSGGVTPVPGSYLYTPGSGTRFSSTGPQVLHVTFTPTDTLDYNKASASTTLQVYNTGIVAWGDSLTYGVTGYPAYLQALVYLPVENQGVPGQTSTQIGVREGGVSSSVRIPSGVIPATGGVTIVFPPGYEPLTAFGPVGGVLSTIQGVHGKVTGSFPPNSAQPVYTFTRSTPGTDVIVPGTFLQFVVDTPYSGFIPVFWEGRNNFKQTSQVLADIAAQVATVHAGQNYLIISITNGNFPNEWKGGSDYNMIIDLNSQLSHLYGSNYLDIRRILVDSYDPMQAADVTDYLNDEPPTSLRPVAATGSLTSAISPGDTSIDVAMTSGTLQASQVLELDSGATSENVLVLKVLSANSVSVKRGYGGGTPFAHNANVAVQSLDQIHFNAKAEQIIANAVAQYFSVYANPVAQPAPSPAP